MVPVITASLVPYPSLTIEHAARIYGKSSVIWAYSVSNPLSPTTGKLAWALYSFRFLLLGPVIQVLPYQRNMAESTQAICSTR